MLQRVTRGPIRWFCSGVVGVVVLLVVGAAAAKQASHSPHLVTDTVYDGGYAESQNTWSEVPIQFDVTRSDRVHNFAEAYAYCGPPGKIALTGADVHNDKFKSVTFAPAGSWKLTVSGEFERGGEAKGTGILDTVTIEDDKCVEKGHWRAKALPEGTQFCYSVDSGHVTRTTVTDMTCGEAELAYLDGVRNDPSGSTTDFQPEGWDCKPPTDDLSVSIVCDHGKKTFRLPV
jgi:hypothetical protein